MKLYSLDKIYSWEGEVSSNTFITKEVKLDFDISRYYFLDNDKIKITKQETDMKYRSVLYFEIVDSHGPQNQVTSDEESPLDPPVYFG